MKDIRQRKCGCVYFEVGPPVQCPKHQAKEERFESLQLRSAARACALRLGHDLTDWIEYDSKPGKWTSYCHGCGAMAIVYDSPAMTLGDQILGNALTKDCRA
jgi:MinD superfamily P-loop ATPase